MKKNTARQIPVFTGRKGFQGRLGFNMLSAPVMSATIREARKHISHLFHRICVPYPSDPSPLKRHKYGKSLLPTGVEHRLICSTAV